MYLSTLHLVPGWVSKDIKEDEGVTLCEGQGSVPQHAIGCLAGLAAITGLLLLLSLGQLFSGGDGATGEAAKGKGTHLASCEPAGGEAAKGTGLTTEGQPVWFLGGQGEGSAFAALSPIPLVESSCVNMIKAPAR